MRVITLIFAALAALMHLFIFWMESLRWERAATRRVFGTTPEQAATTRQLAFNQGFYNLFLAIIAAAGVALFWWPVVSATLLLVSLGSMLAAALVLGSTDRRKLRAALVQGMFPALGLAFLALGTIA